MRPIQFRLGISRLEDGTEVMTPFGQLGKTYLYDPLIAGRYARLFPVLAWIGVAIFATAIVRYYLGKASAEQTFALFPLAFITLDCLRVLIALRIFRHARRLHIDTTFSDEQRRDLRWIPGYGTDALIIWWLFALIEAIFFAGAVAEFATGKPSVATAATCALVFHLMSYVCKFFNAYIKGYC